jgi:hypothetical protein
MRKLAARHTDRPQDIGGSWRCPFCDSAELMIHLPLWQSATVGHDPSASVPVVAALVEGSEIADLAPIYMCLDCWTEFRKPHRRTTDLPDQFDDETWQEVIRAVEARAWRGMEADKESVEKALVDAARISADGLKYWEEHGAADASSLTPAQLERTTLQERYAMLARLVMSAALGYGLKVWPEPDGGRSELSIPGLLQELVRVAGESATRRADPGRADSDGLQSGPARRTAETREGGTAPASRMGVDDEPDESPGEAVDGPPAPKG